MDGSYRSYVDHPRSSLGGSMAHMWKGLSIPDYWELILRTYDGTIPQIWFGHVWSGWFYKPRHGSCAICFDHKEEYAAYYFFGGEPNTHTICRYRTVFCLLICLFDPLPETPRDSRKFIGTFNFSEDIPSCMVHTTWVLEPPIWTLIFLDNHVKTISKLAFSTAPKEIHPKIVIGIEIFFVSPA